MPAKKKTTQRTLKKTKARKTAATKKSKASTRKNTSKTSAIKVALKKVELYRQLSEATGLSKKDIVLVFDELSHTMRRHLRKGGAGEFTIPSLMKLVVKKKPPTKAREGINPFTGEPTVFKAKPARKVIKIRALKRLKEMVE